MIDKIDLKRHGIIEASAGTGKTHTLVNLVLRLLKETEVKLEEILLVTFTEKATGELKDRLRETLESESRANAEQRLRLQAALDSLDQARIHTIHGFCQRALHEHALENGRELRPQIADDRELLETCLREIQRKEWPQNYGEQLRHVLDLAGYSSSTGGGAGWESFVRQLALSFRPRCEHLLTPKVMENWPAVLETLDGMIREQAPRMRQLAEPLDFANREQHAWCAGFGELDFQHRDARRRGVLVPLLYWLANLRSVASPVATFAALLEHCKPSSTFRKEGFHALTECLKKETQSALESKWGKLIELVEILETLRRSAEWDLLKQQLTLLTLHQLQRNIVIYKRERGLQSYEDMLTGLDEALEVNPQANALCRLLREQFRYAIVDEFQDTDPIQWRIFRRIFVDGANEHRLFVVGDPKQAIFGFRGADVYAYKTATEELKAHFRGVSYPLAVNWRSSPDLIEALNNLFDNGDWFKGAGIDFVRVRGPDAGERRYSVVNDGTGRSALCALDLCEYTTLVPARREYARFIAAEIRRLLGTIDGKAAMEVQEKDQKPRLLNAADFCILVYRRSEVPPIMKALQEAGIPYSFYKQTGLWESDEASHLHFLLRALARPDDLQAFHKGLLTCFFRIRPEELCRCEQLPSGHEARRLFDRWVKLAEVRDWAQLFHSVLEDSGVLFHASANAERRLANFRYIMQTLEQAAYSQDLDLLGVLELLRDKRRYGGEGDSDYQPIDTEQEKVKIMTVHASKGLEFPVVFLAGGFTQGNRTGCITYRQNGKLAFDLCPDEAAKALARAEQDSEDRRLLYVALTRAIYKLYVPRLNPEKNYKGRGPVATILARALQAAGVEAIPFSPGEIDFAPLEAVPAARGVNAKPQPEAAPKELFPQLPSDLSRRRIFMRSFSSLHRDHPYQALAAPTFGDRPPRPGDEEPDAPQAEDSLRGTAFGSLVHDVLERIRFDEVGAAEAADHLLKEGSDARLRIDERVEWYLPELKSRFPEAELRAVCRKQVAGLVFNALHTPLAAIGGPLWLIPEQDRLQELEFHFPEWEGPAPAEVTRSEGFYTGFMDLVCRKNGKYFLVDWKTNALAGYSLQQIAESMRDSDYHEQYRLYLHALNRWFKRIQGNAFDFARDFGGVYYLYLRGMNGKDESTGVFFHRPTAEDLKLNRAPAAFAV